MIARIPEMRFLDHAREPTDGTLQDLRARRQLHRELAGDQEDEQGWSQRDEG